MTTTYKLSTILVLVVLLLHITTSKDCPDDEFVHGDSCNKACPEAYWNKTCVAECPAGLLV